jgi:hypothetical protein
MKQITRRLARVNVSLRRVRRPLDETMLGDVPARTAQSVPANSSARQGIKNVRLKRAKQGVKSTRPGASRKA